jgi:hypothetical protein
MAKITEAELADVIEAILATRPNGETTLAELIDEIPNHINLSLKFWRNRRLGQTSRYGINRYVTLPPIRNISRQCYSRRSIGLHSWRIGPRQKGGLENFAR